MMLTNEQLESLSMEAKAVIAVGRTYSIEYVQAENVLQLIDELERVKLDAINTAFKVETEHKREVEDLKVQFSERALDWQIQHEREIADLRTRLVDQ